MGQADPTIVMLDQLARVVSMAALNGFFHAVAAAPVAYVVLRLALRKS